MSHGAPIRLGGSAAAGLASTRRDHWYLVTDPPLGVPCASMARHYNHAPIAEAVIDLRVDWPANAPAKALDDIAASLKQQFPSANPIHSISVGLTKLPGAAAHVETGEEILGVRLESEAKDRVLQIQKAGFTYSHLPPYTDWESFRSEARPLWDAYSAGSGATSVIRAAVRVINKLPVAGTFADLGRYSNLALAIPSEMGLSPSTFFAQVQTSADALIEGCRVIINTGMASLPEDRLELLLDFDIYVEGRWDASASDLWVLLDKLSGLKDRVFEACITNTTRGLIE